MKTDILFFGILTDVTGAGSVNFEDLQDLEHLKKVVLEKFPELENYRYRISVNRVMTDKNVSLKDGDEVAFLPPFAGG